MRRIASTMILAAIFACATIHSSQQPTEDQDVLPEQQSDTSPSQPPAPAPIVITDQPSAGAGQQASTQADEQENVQREIAEGTSRIAEYTERLANYTLALVIVGAAIGILQIIVLIWQSKHTGKAATAARVNAEAAMMTERASIGVVTMRLDDPGRVLSAPWIVTVGLSNFGRTTATINTATITLRQSATLPPEPAYNSGHSTTCPPLLAAGESSNWRHLVQWYDIEREPLDVPLDGVNYPYWAYGRILFTDIFGNQHEYGFCREWRPTDQALFHKDSSERFGYPPFASYNYAREVEQNGHTRHRRWYWPFRRAGLPPGGLANQRPS